MTPTPELVFDHEPTGENVGAVTRVRWVLFGTGLAIVIVVITVVVSSGPTPRTGVQVDPAHSIALETPAVDGWELLAPLAGDDAIGAPPPMVWRSDRVCVGFGRVDFGPDDLRPSLARCEPHPVEAMAANEIRSLAAVESGFDTWHFVEAADRIDSISLRLATGEEVSDDRIHVAGSTAALRLENDRDLASLRWSTATDTYRCTPDPAAWKNSEFCADSGNESTD